MKRKKIDALKLSEEEWIRVRLFCNLLSVRPFLYDSCLCSYIGSLVRR